MGADKGKRNAEKIVLMHTVLFSSIDEFKKLKELEKRHKELSDRQQPIPKEESGQYKNLVIRLKDKMRPGRNERYFFLPPAPFIDALLIDFQNKISVTYEVLEIQYETIASLDDPIAQAVLTSYTRYQSSVGYPDLDIDYTFDRIKLKAMYYRDKV
jgi:hypothetical protein